MAFNYSKLRGKIIEKYGTLGNFLNKYGNMAHPTFSFKLNGKSEWTQQEIYTIMKLLDEPLSKVDEYFFSKQC